MIKLIGLIVGYCYSMERSLWEIKFYDDVVLNYIREYVECCVFELFSSVVGKDNFL